MKSLTKGFFKINKRNLIWLIIIVLLIGFWDAQNGDNFLYKILHFGPLPYYDLPIWDFYVAIGTISAAVVALLASYRSLEIERKQSEYIEKQITIEQTPHVVINDRVQTARNGDREELQIIHVSNVGRGSAITVTVTADPEGKISIIEGSNPHSINLTAGEHKTNWAVDKNRVLEGLVKQGKKLKSIQDVPNENDLDDNEMEKADFYLYLWYEDQLGNKYRTATKIRHSGYFFKVMENKVEKIGK